MISCSTHSTLPPSIGFLTEACASANDCCYDHLNSTTFGGCVLDGVCLNDALSLIFVIFGRVLMSAFDRFECSKPLSGHRNSR